MADFFFAIGRDEVTWRLSPEQASDRGSPLIGPVPSGTSQVEFFARNGAGCDFINGGPCDGNPRGGRFSVTRPIWNGDNNYRPLKELIVNQIAVGRARGDV